MIASPKVKSATASSYRFYLDEDVPKGAAKIARALGLDVISADEVGPIPQKDSQHLAIAARDGRILVTYNRDDFIEVTREAFATGRPHAGVLILTHRLPRKDARVAHALLRWSKTAVQIYGSPPLQAYMIDFLSE